MGPSCPRTPCTSHLRGKPVTPIAKAIISELRHVCALDWLPSILLGISNLVGPFPNHRPSHTSLCISNAPTLIGLYSGVHTKPLCFHHGLSGTRSCQMTKPVSSMFTIDLCLVLCGARFWFSGGSRSRRDISRHF